MTALAALRAPLFVPATRPERFAKAASSGADAVILDLEDAVAPADKPAARAALRADFTELPVIVRINPAGTPWHAEDLVAAAAHPFAAVMLPKAESAGAVEAAAAATGLPVLALVETAHGLAAAREIAGAAARMVFGSIDFCADLGCDPLPAVLDAARFELVLAARLAAAPAPWDGVTANVADPGAAAVDAAHARAMGMGGKLLIHPRQAAPVRAAFRPSEAQVDWARRVLAAGEGAAQVDGEMVDEPVRLRARAILSAAEG